MDGNSERAAFAEQLRRLRADAGFSLGELAGLAHAHRGYLGHLEHGERWPSRAVVKALDDALDAGGVLLDAWRAADGLARTVPARVDLPGDDEAALALPVDEWTGPDAVTLAERIATADVPMLSAAAARRLVN